MNQIPARLWLLAILFLAALLTIKPVTDPVDPAPQPIPAGQMRVLIVYDETQSTKITRGQFNAIHSADMEAFLDAKCGKDAKYSGWRKFDKGKDVSKEPPMWQAAFEFAKHGNDKLPWLVIFTPSDSKISVVYDGPLLGMDEAKATIRKYGG